MHQLAIDQDDIEEARRLNRKLARSPRFRVRNRIEQVAIQSMLRLSQLGADGRMRRAGLSVENRLVGDGGHRVGVRVLRPAGPIRGVVLDVHGGGWVIGNARMDDALNRALVDQCGVATVSIEYRRAGAASVEAMIEDCLVAARWLIEGGLAGTDGLPIIATGESAGAHLVTATLLKLRRRPELIARITGAVLYYGCYDLTGTPSLHAAGPDTLVLDGPSLAARLRRLTPGISDAERRRPPLSPLYGDLTGLPPALMFAGELDPLRDDTVQMAERWRDKAAVEAHLVPQSPHGFIRFPTVIARKVLQRTHDWVGARLDRSEGDRPPLGG